MKLQELPPEIRNAILQSAMRVMSESADMHHMLQKADVLLKHDFDLQQSSHMETTLNLEDAEDTVYRIKWIAEFKKLFEDFWQSTGYPRKYWNYTFDRELGNWTGYIGSYKETDAKSAAEISIAKWTKTEKEVNE